MRMSPKLLSAFGSAALTVMSVGLSDPAVASTIMIDRMQHVAFDRALLATPEGRATLREHIQQASAAVCSSDEADRDAISQCRAAAFARADHDLAGQLLAGR